MTFLGRIVSAAQLAASATPTMTHTPPTTASTALPAPSAVRLLMPCPRCGTDALWTWTQSVMLSGTQYTAVDCPGCQDSA